LGVQNNQCIFVGDDPDSDIEGALNADMEAVWIDRFPDNGRFEGVMRVHRVKSIYEYFAL
jgi:FMN phosphatase YigB (HAD superfamily)